MTVEQRCRSALTEDAETGTRHFAKTSLGGLLAAADAAERAAIAAWIQRELARRHREDDRELSTLQSAVWHIQPGWPADTVAWALALASDVARERPAGTTYLLAMPYAATTDLTAAERARLAEAWTWFADRADLLGRMWPGRHPDLARTIERLLPAGEGSADPDHVWSDRCPLAGPLRARLPMTDRATVELLGLCWQLWDQPPADNPALFTQLRPLLDAGGDRTLRLAVLVALAHEPVEVAVWAGGRRERRRIWCAPSTLQLLSGALQALATVAEPWVVPLLRAVGAQAVVFHPVRLGRRPPLLTEAVRALVRRDAPAEARELAGIYAAYPEELRPWRWTIERQLAAHGIEMP